MPISKVIVSEYDLSLGSVNYETGLIKEDSIVTVQCSFASLTGTIDGTVTLKGGLDESNYDTLGLSETMVNNDSFSLQDGVFGHAFGQIVVDVVNVTGGTMTVKLHTK